MTLAYALRMTRLLRWMVAAIATASVCGMASCSGDGEANDRPGSGATSGSGGSGAIAAIDAGSSDSGLDPDSACAAQSEEASLLVKPVDIVFVIDNSGSMGNENAAVQTNINQNFANIIGASGIDYRVILISAYDDGNEVQIGPPLGGGTGGSKPHENPPLFRHYDVTVNSHNALCRLLDTYAVPDPHGFGGGWKDWLRTEAFKIFVVVTDDGVSCTSTRTGNSYKDGNSAAAGVTAGDAWDLDLLAMDAAQFGTTSSRNYVFHGILGIDASADASKAHFPSDPITSSQCPTGVDPGTGYQHLSMLSGGLRFPVCEGSGFDVVFQKIAEGVIQGAKVACELQVPQGSDGKQVDLATVQVKYTPGSGGVPEILEQVSDASACKPNAFYIESDVLKLCPDACSTIQGDDAAKLSVLYGCKLGGPR